MRLTNGRPQVNPKLKQKSDLHSYPVHAEVEYVARRGRTVEKGYGQAFELSGTELVLDCGRRLASGMDIEVRLAWPGSLGILGGLMLHIKGRISVNQGNRSRVEIVEYDFETRPEPAAKPVKSSREILQERAPLAS